jgi:hypothetical protein
MKNTPLHTMYDTGHYGCHTRPHTKNKLQLLTLIHERLQLPKINPHINQSTTNIQNIILRTPSMLTKPTRALPYLSNNCSREVRSWAQSYIFFTSLKHAHISATSAIVFIAPDFAPEKPFASHICPTAIFTSGFRNLSAIYSDYSKQNSRKANFLCQKSKFYCQYTTSQGNSLSQIYTDLEWKSALGFHESLLHSFVWFDIGARYCCASQTFRFSASCSH